MTIIETILARSSGRARVAPGDFVVVDVDMTVILDMSFLANTRREFLRLHDPEKTAVIFDHLAPAPDTVSADAHVHGRVFVERFGIRRFHDVGRDQGICHTIIAENGYARPGTVLISSDSHTCAAGAFNCAARGVGFPDMVYAATTGKAWFRLGETVRYDLDGALAPGVSAKDVFLFIAGAFGGHSGRNIEFGGPGMAGLSLDARRALATMGAELGADFTTFEPDDRLLAHFEGLGVGPLLPVMPDPDARYAARRVLDLSAIRPMIALPHAVVDNVADIDVVAGRRIDQAYIGSCANGGIEDIAEAARVLAGRRVARGVRLIVTPASQAVLRQALAAGHIATLVEAGAIVTPPTCGACYGGHTGILGPGEVCVTASTRNFKGRMGHPDAAIYMASPATVAACAVAGMLVHPDSLDGAAP